MSADFSFRILLQQTDLKANTAQSHPKSSSSSSLNLNGLHYKSSMVTALVASDRRLLSFQDEVILLFPNPDVETHNCSKLWCLEEKFTSI